MTRPEVSPTCDGGDEAVAGGPPTARPARARPASAGWHLDDLQVRLPRARVPARAQHLPHRKRIDARPRDCGRKALSGELAHHSATPLLDTGRCDARALCAHEHPPARRQCIDDSSSAAVARGRCQASAASPFLVSRPRPPISRRTAPEVPSWHASLVSSAPVSQERAARQSNSPEDAQRPRPATSAPGRLSSAPSGPAHDEEDDATHAAPASPARDEADWPPSRDRSLPMFRVNDIVSPVLVGRTNGAEKAGVLNGIRTPLTGKAAPLHHSVVLTPPIAQTRPSTRFCDRAATLDRVCRVERVAVHLRPVGARRIR